MTTDLVVIFSFLMDLVVAIRTVEAEKVHDLLVLYEILREEALLFEKQN